MTLRPGLITLPKKPVTGKISKPSLNFPLEVRTIIIGFASVFAVVATAVAASGPATLGVKSNSCVPSASDSVPVLAPLVSEVAVRAAIVTLLPSADVVVMPGTPLTTERSPLAASTSISIAASIENGFTALIWNVTPAGPLMTVLTKAPFASVVGSNGVSKSWFWIVMNATEPCAIVPCDELIDTAGLSSNACVIVNDLPALVTTTSLRPGVPLSLTVMSANSEAGLDRSTGLTVTSGPKLTVAPSFQFVASPLTSTRAVRPRNADDGNTPLAVGGVASAPQPIIVTATAR